MLIEIAFNAFQSKLKPFSHVIRLDYNSNELTIAVCYIAPLWKICCIIWTNGENKRNNKIRQHAKPQQMLERESERIQAHK